MRENIEIETIWFRSHVLLLSYLDSAYHLLSSESPISNHTTAAEALVASFICLSTA